MFPVEQLRFQVQILLMIVRQKFVFIFHIHQDAVILQHQPEHSFQLVEQIFNGRELLKMQQEFGFLEQETESDCVIQVQQIHKPISSVIKPQSVFISVIEPKLGRLHHEPDHDLEQSEDTQIHSSQLEFRVTSRRDE